MGRKFIAAVKVFEELRLTVLNCLVNIFGRAHSLGPNSIRELSLLQLSAEVNVKVIVVRVLQRHIAVDLLKHGRGVVVQDKDIVNVAKDT